MRQTQGFTLGYHVSPGWGWLREKVSPPAMAGSGAGTRWTMTREIQKRPSPGGRRVPRQLAPLKWAFAEKSLLPTAGPAATI